MAADPSERLSLFQWLALRRIRRAAGKRRGEPLTSEDWIALWRLEHTFGARTLHRLWHVLPSSPRCRRCAAPFAGVGRLVTRPLGYRPSRKNPAICSTCVELSPPGGAKMMTGVLFADVRGFTSTSEGADPEETSKLLRRFYGCAERALFPEAIIDKLIGDEVMALYIEHALPGENIPQLMVDHAEALLAGVGHGADEAPFVEVGVGLDFGEAFVGNIGEHDVYDFTAVGDVVNTASRLQAEAKGGEIVVSSRVWSSLPSRPGERVDLHLKGKSAPETA